MSARACRPQACTGPRAGAARRQRGVAAVEFVLVFMGLFLCLYTFVHFGVVFYTQQVLSRAATDGALAISADSRSYQPDAVREVVHQSLARSLVAPVGSVDYASRLSWVRTQVTVNVPAASAGSVVLDVRYPYARNAVLPSLPGLGLVLPADLVGRATVAIGS